MAPRSVSHGHPNDEDGKVARFSPGKMSGWVQYHRILMPRRCLTSTSIGAAAGSVIANGSLSVDNRMPSRMNPNGDGLTAPIRRCVRHRDARLEPPDPTATA
jgi:hypothetical protein